MDYGSGGLYQQVSKRIALSQKIAGEVGIIDIMCSLCEIDIHCSAQNHFNFIVAHRIPREGY